MSTYIRCKQNKHMQHENIKQLEPPHQYRLGTMSNIKLLGGLTQFYRRLTSPSAFAVLLIYIHINNKYGNKKILYIGTNMYIGKQGEQLLMVRLPQC